MPLVQRSERADAESGLERAADVVTARMADVCAVYLREGDDLRRVLCRARVGLDLAGLGEVLLAEDERDLVTQALATRRSIRVERAKPRGRGWDVPGLDRRLAPRAGSTIVAPMCLSDRVLGVLLLARLDAAPPYRDEDRAYAEAVASLTALALDYRELLAEREEFVADLAHELKTPLTSILLAAQLAERRGDVLSAPRYAQRITVGLRELRTIIDGMLGRFVALRRVRDDDARAEGPMLREQPAGRPSR